MNTLWIDYFCDTPAAHLQYQPAWKQARR